MNSIEKLARQTLQENRVAIFLVAYNAEKHISKVLSRIPPWISKMVAEIYIIDDHSTDETVKIARSLEWPSEYAPLKIYKTPFNQGYGGNQRLGYLYAIQNNFDIVVLLHADGQYAPEALPEILAPYSHGADAVFGSRFIKPMDALKGHMPLYKWIGNQILTKIQNLILGTKMSEMHSGYRSYRMSAMAQVPFEFNSLGFDFDADIIIQFVAAGFKIVEVPIPTFYGDEICRVNGMQYAWKCVLAATRYRLMGLELFYDPRYDLRLSREGHYTSKKSPYSLHHYIRELNFEKGVRVLDVGGGDGSAVSKAQADRGAEVVCIDQMQGAGQSATKHFYVNLDQPWSQQIPQEEMRKRFEVVFALDVLEHLSIPEAGAEEIFEVMRRGGTLYASTGNIAFLPLRIMLLLGQFNYGRRGILDLTHRRLFTIRSFKRLLRNAGFQVEKIVGFGPPLADEISSSWFMKLVDRWAFYLAQKWPSLFAFHFLAVCKRPDSLEDILQGAFQEQSFPASMRTPHLILETRRDSGG